MHARLGIPFTDVIQSMMLVISSSQGEFYTKNQIIIVFVFVMSTGTLLVADHICSIIIPTEQLGQMT